MHSPQTHPVPPTQPEPAAGAEQWTKAPERGSMAALRLIAWIATRFGRPLTRCLMHPIAAYFVVFNPAARRNVKRYLNRALSRPARMGDVYRLFLRFATTVLDRVYFLKGFAPGMFDLQVTGAQALHGNLHQGRGAFVVGAHLGSFEAIGATGRHQQHVSDLRISMLMYPNNAQRVNAVLHALAPPDQRPGIIALGRPTAMLALRDWLDSGGLAGMLADRTLPGQDAQADRHTRSALIAFLGRDAVFNDGPFRLAELLRRPVFFVAGLYEGGARYDVRFELLADFSERATTMAEREQRILGAMQAYAARLEMLCRESPYNWFNFHDFWNEDAIP